MKEIELTQGKVTIVDDEDFDYLMSLGVWYFDGRYASIWTYVLTGQLTQIRMHKMVATRKGLVGLIDHKDRNKLNNQRSNLRESTKELNAFNSKEYINNTSGAKGVWFSKTYNKWFAEIRYLGRKICRGFHMKSEAIEYRKFLEKTYYGDV